MEIASKGMVKPNNENIMIDYGSLMHSTQSRDFHWHKILISVRYRT